MGFLISADSALPGVWDGSERPVAVRSSAAGAEQSGTHLDLGPSVRALPMFTHSFLGAGQEAAQEKALEVVADVSWQEDWRTLRGDTDTGEEIAVKVPNTPACLPLPGSWPFLPSSPSCTEFVLSCEWRRRRVLQGGS